MTEQIITDRELQEQEAKMRALAISNKKTTLPNVSKRVNTATSSTDERAAASTPEQQEKEVQIMEEQEQSTSEDSSDEYDEEPAHVDDEFTLKELFPKPRKPFAGILASCKFDKTGKSVLDEGYKPCQAPFDDSSEFLKHAWEKHGKYGCRYHRCGQVFDTQKALRRHKRAHHHAAVQKEARGNLAEYFISHVRERQELVRKFIEDPKSDKIFGQQNKDTLVFSPDHLSVLALEPTERRKRFSKIQDKSEMEQFYKFAETPEVKEVVEKISSLLETQQRLMEAKDVLDEPIKKLLEETLKLIEGWIGANENAE